MMVDGWFSSIQEMQMSPVLDNRTFVKKESTDRGSPAGRELFAVLNIQSRPGPEPSNRSKRKVPKVGGYLPIKPNSLAYVPYLAFGCRLL